MEKNGRKRRKGTLYIKKKVDKRRCKSKRDMNGCVAMIEEW